jgi:co-chaperonin GroES (HSP10)
MINLKGRRLLIELNKSKRFSPSGLIYLPDTVQEKRYTGKVVAVGDGADPEFLGKEVLFDIAASTDLNLPDISGKLVFQTSIIAILN